ncbi:MAG TPA: ferric reductase-like transmembrane domain-containing protein [Solirubrobacteraceae bacterium]|nr:ferric reductase-like transmembrane domain-containing protein [Solirubrobacteraceae bacterium]
MGAFAERGVISPKDPTPYLWWLVGRASGIVALALITVAVLLGLTMSTKLLRRPGIGRTLVRLHEHVALVSLGAIAAHGLALLADPWLRPGVRGLIVPFAMSYRPLFTGLGIIAGYLAALLALSFYARRRIGVKRWRKVHRATVLVWVLGVVHTLGAGSDAATQWLRAFTLLPAIPIVYLVVLRMLGDPRRHARREPPPRAAAPHAPQRRPALAQEPTS